MNVTANTHTAQTDAPAKSPAGELVVQNGRLKGTRRALTGPLTLIGQAIGCEIRLNIEGVKPLHCALIQGPEGYMVRDMSGEAGTCVNGQRVNLHALQHGDVLAVGPFQFALEIPAGVRPENVRRLAEALKAERDALRIQVAAVAAQQAGLTEEEIRLEQRRVALQCQEEQLAARLEERQRELKGQEEQLCQDQDRFASARAAEEERQAQAREELLHARAEQEQAGKLVTGERRRLADLRKRLKRRWQEHWQAQRTKFDQCEQQVASQQARLQKEVENLERERARINEFRLRFNGEMELGRRQLQEEWQELALAQQQWEVTLNLEQGERTRRVRELEEREAVLGRGEQKLVTEKQFWTRRQAVLEMEVEGLDNRIRNQRQKLLELEGDLAQHVRAAVGAVATGGSPVAGLATGEPPVATAESAVASVMLPAKTFEVGSEGLPQQLEHLAGELADQRMQLLEQWQRLLRAEEAWQKERETTLVEVEDAGQCLQQREQRLDERAVQIQVQERALEGRLTHLQQRQESLSQLRCSLEGWQARLTVQASDWELQREEVLTAVRAREEALAAQTYRVEELHRRRTQRLKIQASGLLKAQQRLQAIRKQYLSLWKSCRQHHKALLEEQQAVAQQTLTLEQFRLECLAQAPSQAAAEKRLERLQRGCLALTHEAERQVEQDRQVLGDENNRLEERALALDALETELRRRQEEVSAQQTDLENQQLATSEGEARRLQEVQRLQNYHRVAEQQIKELRDEVERLARMLLDEVDTSVSPAANQAA